MPSSPAISAADLSSFRSALLRWYKKYRRDLPWRRTSDPYCIWLSEIMLQQTRVSAVQEHYRHFLARFPNIRALAAAEISDVLAAWSGLGYYRRARSMHRAARVIVEEHKGEVPRTLDALLSLPGIGRYTSAAIGSIAFQLPAAVVDGNVERVLTRLSGRHMQNSSALTHAQELLYAGRPGDWNQAMMELGATVCLPVGPRCSECPIERWCKAPGANTSRPDPARRKLERVVGLATRRGRVYLVRRSERESLMPGMWELPETSVDAGERVARVKHSITVTDYDIVVVSFTPNGDRSGRWVNLATVAALPLTGLTRKILRVTNLFPGAQNQKQQGTNT